MTRKWLEEPVLENDNSYPISASAIKSFYSCPKQYQFRYKTDKPSTKASQGFLELGSAVHEAIEYALKQDTPLQKNQLKGAFHQAYYKVNGKVPDDMDDDAKQYLNVAARFLSSKSPNIQGIEKKFKFGLARQDIDSRFRGIMDITTENEIWDWKTGRVRDETPIEEKIQGAVYMRGFYELYDTYPESISFIYLKEEKQRTIESSDEVWDEMISHASDLVEAQNVGEYEATPGGQCFFCGYEQFCPQSPTGAGDVDWVNF